MDSAAILSGNDIEPEMKARFDAPIPSVGPKHLLGIHLCSGAGGDEVFGFDFFGWFAWAVNATGQPGRLLRKREIGSGGAGVKSNEAARLGATAV